MVCGSRCLELYLPRGVEVCIVVVCSLGYLQNGDFGGKWGGRRSYRIGILEEGVCLFIVLLCLLFFLVLFSFFLSFFVNPNYSDLCT